MWAGSSAAAGAVRCCVPHRLGLAAKVATLTRAPPPAPPRPALHHSPNTALPQVLGGEYREELLRLIAPEHLLAAYGGTNPAPLR